MNNTTTLAQRLKQPRGLYNLFLVELWERFGFYAVQSLLVLFLSKAYHFSDGESFDVYSAFSALIFATPVIGGYVADKLLGFRRAVLLGGVIYIIGYFALATANRHVFYPALALLIWGNGFFKSCVSSLLGTLYEDNDPRRDGGFTLFYMGINVGAFISPIVCTWAAIRYGWGTGFGLAALGMVIGVITFLKGYKYLGNHGLPSHPQRLTQRGFLKLSWLNLLYLSLIVFIFFTVILLQHARLTNDLLLIFEVLILIFLVFATFYIYKGEQRNKMLVLIILTVFSIFFWALYNQTFSSLTLFTDRIVNRQLFGWTIPTAMFQSVNPFFIIVLSPILAQLWVKTNNTRWEISTPAKFTIALFLMALGFLVLPLGITLAGADGSVGMKWLNLSYFLQTVGELSISPIGLSMVTALAPTEIQGMMMGVWFLSTAAAYTLGDYLANMTDIPATMTNVHAINAIYNHAFIEFGIASLLLCFVLLLTTPWLRRLAISR